MDLFFISFHFNQVYTPYMAKSIVWDCLSDFSILNRSIRANAFVLCK